MIIEEIQEILLIYLKMKSKNMSKKFILKTQIWLNVYNVLKQITVMK